MTPERDARLRALSRRLGHEFRDLALLDRALTHTSHAHEAGRRVHNEPLEFLGDSVLGLVISEMLHRRDPEGAEGKKSKARAHLVGARSLARRAEGLGIPELLQLGRGEEKTGGRQKQALWADAFEAVVAALYLDGGLEAAEGLVRAEFADAIGGAASVGAAADAKSALQEFLQARGEPVPGYVVVAEEGPGHRTSFRVQCLIGGAVAGEGTGFSKKEAQQEAARLALSAIRRREVE